MNYLYLLFLLDLEKCKAKWNRIKSGYSALCYIKNWYLDASGAPARKSGEKWTEYLRHPSSKCIIYLRNSPVRSCNFFWTVKPLIEEKLLVMREKATKADEVEQYEVSLSGALGGSSATGGVEIRLELLRHRL